LTAGFEKDRLTTYNGFGKEEAMERTLSIVKPDGVGKHLIGEVVKRFEDHGLKVIGLKMIFMDKREAEGFYAVHRGKPFFDSGYGSRGGKCNLQNERTHGRDRPQTG
jgi:hypothetical protein